MSATYSECQGTAAALGRCYMSLLMPAKGATNEPIVRRGFAVYHGCPRGRVGASRGWTDRSRMIRGAFVVQVEFFQHGG